MKSIVYNTDCLAAMRTMPDKAFDLAIVDPPYGLERFKANDGGNSKKITTFGDKDKNWNNIKPTAEYWNELFRVSKNQIVWGGNNFELPTSEYFIVWDKQQSVPNFASAEYAWTNCKMPAKVFRYPIHQLMQERASEGGAIHPTQKPVALYRWLLTNYAKPGDTILDTHLGSGSSRIAAYDLGFDFTGYELDKDYFDAQEARFANHIAQARLFDAPVLETVEQNPLF